MTLGGEISNTQFLDIWIKILVPIASLVGVVTWLNSHFPSHLSITFKEERSTKRAASWGEWARRKVYGSGTINLVFLRDQQEWFDDDRKALRDIIKMCPMPKKDGWFSERKSLIVVIEAPTRAILDRSLLRAVSTVRLEKGRAKDVEILDIPENVEVIACLAREPDLLDLQKIEASEDNDIAPLIGLEDATEVNQQTVKNSIRAQKFTVSDLIPMLAVGSTYLDAMNISIPAVEGSILDDKDFLSDFLTHGKLFENEQNYKVDRSREERLRTWLNEAKRASSCVIEERTRDRNARFLIHGRYQRRQAILSAMISDDQLFRSDDKGFKDYVQGMLVCGQIGALKRVADLIQEADKNRSNGRSVVNALFSALILREEVQKMGIPLSGTRVTEVDATWQKTLQSLEQIELYEGQETLWAAQVFALSQHLRDEPLRIVSKGTTSLEKAFLEEVERACAVFQKVDRTWARHFSETKLAQLSRMLPERDRLVLDAHIVAHERLGRHLADFYGATVSETELVEAFEHHSKFGYEIATVTLISYLIRQVDSDEDRYKFADLLQRHRGLFVTFSSNTQSRGYLNIHETPRLSALSSLEACLQFMDRKDMGNGANIGHIFNHVDLMFANLAPIDSSRAKLLPIEIDSGNDLNQAIFRF